MSTRDDLFLRSERMEQTEGGWKCMVCGALCAMPGSGHSDGCQLDGAVSMVAPDMSGVGDPLALIRMEAVASLSAQDIDRCHDLAVDLCDGEGTDDDLKAIGEFCGPDAVADGVLKVFADTGDLAQAFQQVVTRLMCERVWFLQSGKRPVTPPVK